MNAIVVPCSSKYTYALNTLLNGADYYGNTAEIHILWWGGRSDLCNEFFDKLELVRDSLGFKVKIIDLKEFLKDKQPRIPDVGWSCKFGRWRYCIHLGEQGYSSICCTGADVAIAHNIMPWIQFVDNSDYLLCGRNIAGGFRFDFKKRDACTSGPPYADAPFFVDPIKHKVLLEHLYAIGQQHDMGDLAAFNYAVDETNYHDKLVLLPDILWLRNSAGLIADNVLFMDILGKQHLVSQLTKQRLHMVHGKWFMKAVRDKYTRGDMTSNKTGAKNPVVFHEFHKFFNSEWKLKLTLNPTHF